jgi:hypothetical protein
MGQQPDRPGQPQGSVKATLVVMAAGMGSRFGGMKQLESVGPDGETILEYSLFDAQRAGFSEVVYIIRREMEAAFSSVLLDRIVTGLSVRLAYQETCILPESWAPSKGTHYPDERERIVRDRNKPWGTGHALWCARDSLDSNFAVINADDYYGPRSFAILYDFLAHTPGDSDRYAMVGFALGKTLSDHGPVARGICGMDKDGYLTDIVEHTRLEAVRENSGSDRIASIKADGSRTYHSGDIPVSMNLFGFTPAFLPRLENLLADFLATSANDPKAEFFLPGAVQSLVSAGSATVRVLNSPETWFGLTYRADIDDVRERLHQLVESGVYPPSLRKSC